MSCITLENTLPQFTANCHTSPLPNNAQVMPGENQVAPTELCQLWPWEEFKGILFQLVPYRPRDFIDQTHTNIMASAVFFQKEAKSLSRQKHEKDFAQ